MSSKTAVLYSSLALYSIVVGVIAAFPLEFMPAHLVGFENPNILHHGLMAGGPVQHHHHHIGMLPHGLDRVNIEPANHHEMNNFGQRTAPTKYNNPSINHNTHPSMVFNQHHPQQLVNHHHHQQQQQLLHPRHQQSLALQNNFNAMHPNYESSQFQPAYYNKQSNNDEASHIDGVSHNEGPISHDVPSNQQHHHKQQHQHQSGHSSNLNQYKAGAAEPRQDHHEEDNKEYHEENHNEEHHHEEPKKDEEAHAHHEEYKQPEAEKKHDHEESHHHEENHGHHEEHHHVPDAIEVHHKKGGKSFQYFHQQHS